MTNKKMIVATLKPNTALELDFLPECILYCVVDYKVEKIDKQ